MASGQRTPMSGLAPVTLDGTDETFVDQGGVTYRARISAMPTGSVDNAILRADGTGGFKGQGSGALVDDGGNIAPAVTDVGGLGTSLLRWSDEFLASGAVIDIGGDWVATHTAGVLTVGTGDLRVTTAGADTASVVTVGGTQTLTNKTLDSPAITGSLTADAFIPAGSTVPTNGMYLPAANVIGWAVNSAAELRLASSALSPAVYDGLSLGSGTLAWASLFLASGGAINFDNGNWVATQSSGVLTVGTGDLRVTTAGSNSASVVTVGGTQTLTAKTLTSPTITTSPTAAGSTWADLGSVTTVDINGGTADGVVIGGSSAAAGTFTTLTVNTNANPDADDGAGLGTGTLGWSDLFLATGGVINFNNGNVTLTHAAGALTIAGGQLNLAAGTTSLAPLHMQSGTNLTTPTAGDFEYDGSVFYATPVASNRALSVTDHFLTLSSNQTGSNVNTAQPWFPGGGATGLTVAGGTTYFFEGLLAFSKTAGTTSRTIGMNFGGSASLTSIAYFVTASAADATSLSNAPDQSSWVEVATNTTVWSTASTSANQYVMIRIAGTVRINAGGTFIPNFQYSAAPGGAPTVRANSWFRMRPAGSGSVLSVGNWV